MKEQEKKMLELAREIYKLAKEISPETTYLDVAVLEVSDGERAHQIYVNNNYWEITTDKIDFSGGLTE